MKIKLEQIGIILLLISIPILLFFYTSTKSEITLNGQVIDFGATVRDDGVHSFLVIELENNQTIRLNYSKASKFNIGNRVIIIEKTSNLFDIKRYLLSHIKNK